MAMSFVAFSPNTFELSQKLIKVQFDHFGMRLPVLVDNIRCYGQVVMCRNLSLLS